MNGERKGGDAALHQLLKRQLRRLGLNGETPPDAAAWPALLRAVHHAYQEGDQDRYLLKRSLTVSSEEMQALYQNLHAASEALLLQERAKLSESEARYQAVVEGVGEVIFQTDASGAWSFLNPAWKTITGFPVEDSLGVRALRFLCPDDRARVLAGLTASGTEGWQGEARYTTRGGELRWIEVRVRPAFVDGQLSGASGTLSDIDARKRAEQALADAGALYQGELEGRVKARTDELVRLNAQLQHDAFHDALTGLPNRALLKDRLGQAIERHQRQSGGGFAVLFLDFDRFKVINDSLGHTAGDALLRALGARLRGCVRPGDTVARLGGDEFVVLLEDVNLERAVYTAGRVQEALRRPFELEEKSVRMSASIGVVGGDPEYRSPEEVLRDADIAMYRAKALGKAGHQVFTRQMREQALSLMALESDLRAAVQGGELQIHYQPIVALQSGRPVGFEALARWNHPTLGAVPPAQFVPIAEETGLITELDRLVLREACRQVRAWQRQFPALPPLTLSVNFSGQQFGHPDLHERVEEILRETGFDPRDLKIEITESVLMQNLEVVDATLARLKALGVQLYIDDFGTGYSSLGYLQRYPVDTIKIDRSFIEGMGRTPEGAELVRTILTMAENLNLKVVAEGIESLGQLEQLQALNCTYGQGYYFSKPLDSLSATSLLEGDQAAAQLALEPLASELWA